MDKFALEEDQVTLAMPSTRGAASAYSTWLLTVRLTGTPQTKEAVLVIAFTFSLVQLHPQNAFGRLELLF